MSPPEAVAVASALQFPEGPLVLPDGSIGFVEVRRGTLSKIGKDGVVQVVADLGGGPNGAALGPDGHVYVANNGGFALERDQRDDPPLRPRHPLQRAARVHRRLDRPGRPHNRRAHRPLPRVRWRAVRRPQRPRVRRDTAGSGSPTSARCGPAPSTAASSTTPAPTVRTSTGSQHPMYGPNGVGLAPDGGRVYVAESHTGRLLAWDVVGPGEVAQPAARDRDRHQEPLRLARGRGRRPHRGRRHQPRAVRGRARRLAPRVRAHCPTR